MSQLLGLLLNLPGHKIQYHRHRQVERRCVDPDLCGERSQEGEHVDVFLFGFSVQDADAQTHEGHAEVHHLAALMRYAQVADGQIGFLEVDSRRRCRSRGRNLLDPGDP
jgi:hypothetical protein